MAYRDLGGLSLGLPTEWSKRDPVGSGWDPGSGEKIPDPLALTMVKTGSGSDPDPVSFRGSGKRTGSFPDPPSLLEAM